MDKLNESGLKELFGRVLLYKLVTQKRQRPGKHYRTRGAAAKHGHTHPAGTKLLRSFIRRGRSENTQYRKLYAEVTGHQYGA